MDINTLKKYKQYKENRSLKKKRQFEMLQKTSIGDYIANKKKYDEELFIIEVSGYLHHLNLYMENLKGFLDTKKERMKIQIEEQIKLLEEEKKVLKEKSHDNIHKLRQEQIDNDIELLKVCLEDLKTIIQ